MDQEKQSNFSHITIGKSDKDNQSVPEEEEVITIGAMESDLAEKEREVPPRKKERPPALSQESDTEDDFGGPMPLMQKIVVIVCAIGFLVAIALLVWFWAFQR